VTCGDDLDANGTQMSHSCDAGAIPGALALFQGSICLFGKAWSAKAKENKVVLSYVFDALRFVWRDDHDVALGHFESAAAAYFHEAGALLNDIAFGNRKLVKLRCDTRCNPTAGQGDFR